MYIYIIVCKNKYTYICTIDLYVLFEGLPSARIVIYIFKKNVRLNYIIEKKTTTTTTTTKLCLSLFL